MNIYFVEKATEGDSVEQITAMRRYFRFTDINSCQAIYCASIDAMNATMLLAKSTDIPIIVYCWDYYKWAHDGCHPGEWDWKEYAKLLKLAKLVIVPSHAQQLRLKELLGLDSVVVRSGVKKYDTRTYDMDFILDPVRYYPEENRTWAEDAAKELGIPIIHSEHAYSKEEFRKLVAMCTFMTCAYREASTGGLTLAEGLWMGKPSLVSNSPYMGARDYLGEYGYYFKYDDFQDLKRIMKWMWDIRPGVDPISYINMQLSFERMAKELYEVCVPISK